jgi:spore germination protein GerM
VQLWFISGTSLNPITRSLTYPATLDQVMVALQAGPSELGPPASSLRTAVPGAPALSARDNLNGTATVDLPVAFFGNIQGQDQLRAIGQIVLTLTLRPGIGGVKFTSAGEDAAVILGNGEQSARGQVVTRADYRALTGDVPPTTPTSSPPSTTAAATTVAAPLASETTVG